MGYFWASGFALARNTCSFSARPRCDTTTWPSCRKRPASDTASVTRPPRFSRRSRIRPRIFDSSSLTMAASTSRATFWASKLVTLRKAMPGWYQKASTRLVSIPPRITVTVIGSGAGKINGPGGRLEQGETALESAIRETQEEVGVTPTGVEQIGELFFQFLDGYKLHVAVFAASGCEGELI